MILYVLRSNLDVVGVIDKWESLLWITKLTSAGEFELYIQASNKNVQYIQKNRYIARSDRNDIMVISSIQEERTENTIKLIISGYSAEGVLRKRLFPLWDKEIVNALNQNRLTLKQIFDSINPIGCKINIGAPDFYFNDLEESDVDTNMEDFIRMLCNRTESTDGVMWKHPQTYHLEFMQSYDKPDKYLTFWTEYLNDPEYSAPIMMLSEDIGNLVDATYTYSDEGCDTAVYAYVDRSSSVSVSEPTGEKDESGNDIYQETSVGYDELYNKTWPLSYRNIADDPLGISETSVKCQPGINRVTDTTTIKKTNRNFIRANTDLGSSIFASTGQLKQSIVRSKSNEFYYQMDGAKTLQMLEQVNQSIVLGVSENLQGTVKGEKAKRLKVNDIVIVRDNRRLVDFYKRVEEIEECWNNNGYKVKPTFGEPLKTIFNGWR